MSQAKRSLLLHLNKYQTQIIYPIAFACIIACMIAASCLFVMFYLDVYHTNVLNFDRTAFKLLIARVIPFLVLILFLLVVWTYIIASRLVGAHNRIIRELDEVVEGKRKSPITSRNGDSHFAELLQRINALIQKLP